MKTRILWPEFFFLLLSLLVPGTVAAQKVLANNFHNELPLKPERKISFVTTEGTCMNLDISPDGQTLVFDLLGKIFRHSMVENETIQLTEGISWDSRPVWSRDGRKIAFISDRSGVANIWIMDQDGKNLQQVSSEKENIFRRGVEWFRGDSLLISDDKIYSLNQPEVVNHPVLKGYVRISRDGSYAYSTYGKDTKKLILKTGKSSLMEIEKGFPKGKTVISPDNQWMVYVTRALRGDSMNTNGLRLRNLRTGQEKWLIQKMDMGRETWERFTFTPGSESVIIGYGGKIHCILIPSGKDEIIPFSAEVSLQLAPFIHNEFPVATDSVEVDYLRYPDQHPKVDKIVFTALSKIYEMGLMEPKPKEIIDAPFGQFQPKYSPDGKYLAFVSWDDTLGGHVWRQTVDEGSLKRLTEDPGVYQRPVWSPKGDKIAVFKRTEEEKRFWGSKDMGQLLLIPSNGGNPRMLAEDIHMDDTPVFNTTGDSIVFVGKAKYFTAPKPVFQINLDNLGKEVLFEVPYHATTIAVSLEEKMFAYVRDHNLYLDSFVEDRPLKKALQLSGAGAMDPRWEENGKQLGWFSGGSFNIFNVEKFFSHLRKGNSEISPETFIEEFIINLRKPSHHGSGMKALTGGRVISMKAGEIIEKATILLQDNRIAAVGPIESIKIPADAMIIDISGKTVIPGLIDMHAHDGPPRDILVNDWSRYRLNLAYGITTTRDPSSSIDMFGYQELIETGQMEGPRIIGAKSLSNNYYQLDNLEDARDIVKAQKTMGARLIKVHDGGTRAQRQFLAIAAREEELNITAHADVDNIFGVFNLSVLLDGFTGWEHHLGLGDTYEDVQQLLSEAGTWFTPTSILNPRQYKKDLEEFSGSSLAWQDGHICPLSIPKDYLNPSHSKAWTPLQKKLSANIVALARTGSRITPGAHGNVLGLNTHWELWMFADAGMSNLDVLKSATILGAKGLGYQKELGSIETGKIADLVILNGNPLENIRNTLAIWAVVKGGVYYTAKELNKYCRME